MSSIDICNHALSLVAADPIVDFSDGTRQAGLCARLYPIVLDQVLEARTWTFSTGRATLLPDATPPVWGYGQQFLIPSDWLRVLEVYANPPTSSNSNPTKPLEWNREGQYILCNKDKVYVSYTFRTTNTALMSPTFRDCLAYRLAGELAIPIAQNRTLMTDMVALYERKLSKAGSIDGAQGMREEKWVGSLVTRR